MPRDSMPTSEGRRPIAEHLSLGASLECNARVHFEEGWYWAEIAELPGCFASGRTTEELTEALAESVGLYLVEGHEPLPVVHVSPEAGWRIAVERSAGAALSA